MIDNKLIIILSLDIAVVGVEAAVVVAVVVVVAAAATVAFNPPLTDKSLFSSPQKV